MKLLVILLACSIVVSGCSLGSMAGPNAEGGDANGKFKGTWALGYFAGTIEFTLARDGERLTGIVTELTGMPLDPGRALSGYIKKNWVLLGFAGGEYRISATIRGDIIEGELSWRYYPGTIRVERVK